MRALVACGVNDAVVKRLELKVTPSHDWQFLQGEAVEPSVDLVALVRAKSLRWLGHVLRAEESYLLKKVVVVYIKDKAEGGYPSGSILMDSPHHRTAE